MLGSQSVDVKMFQGEIIQCLGFDIETKHSLFKLPDSSSVGVLVKQDY